MRILINALATFGGIGYFPVAPGTLSSLILVIAYKFVFYRLSPPLYIAVALAIYAVGVWSASAFAARVNKEDPRTIVIDEVLGQWLALMTIPPGWGYVMISFLLFRFFDIAKPLFIRKAETFRAGWGIMLDDILAGFYANILLNIYLMVR
jgi:phosphatidylglycerophosphatase A